MASHQQDRASQTAAQDQGVGPALDGPQDFGDNSAMIEAMEAAQKKTRRASIIQVQPVERGKYQGDEWTRATIGSGSKHGVSVRDKVVADGVNGAVQKVFPTRAIVMFYGSVDSGTKQCTVHLGESYSHGKDEKDKADKQREDGERESEQDREDEYRTRR